MYIPNKKNQGLTLVEVLVSIFILLMSTVMPMVIYSKSIKNSIYASDQITATYLAQEGIELVRYKISTEFNAGNTWFSSLPDCNSGNCTVVIPDGAICSAGICSSKLYINNNNNLYTHSGVGGIPTKFSRTVKFDITPPKTRGFVSSTVTWKNGGDMKKVILKEYLTKWR